MSCLTPLPRQAPKSLFTWMCFGDMTQRETEAPKGTKGHVWGSPALTPPPPRCNRDRICREEEGVLSQGVDSTFELLGLQAR